MSEKFNLEIISPDKTLLKLEVNQVVIPSFEGLMTILKDHVSLVTFLRPGFIEIGKNEKFYVEDGTVEFTDNNLLILSTSAQSLKNISKEKKNIMLEEAQNKISTNQISDKQKYILNYKIEALKQIS